MESWLALFLGEDVRERAEIRGLSSSATIGSQVNIRNSWGISSQFVQFTSVSPQETKSNVRRSLTC